ncbi:Uncharacterized protein HZ326_12130 [Fusarium oxysporum f. sp. albedinis]|nr:Uncharacterized protein HZ326_12130 [Fusarium oxysporum f. sp. albedinis]
MDPSGGVRLRHLVGKVYFYYPLILNPLLHSFRPSSSKQKKQQSQGTHVVDSPSSLSQKVPPLRRAKETLVSRFEPQKASNLVLAAICHQ